MNDLPRISIVTPSYNMGQYLEATITSILDQNYPNLEYIIIDGGSTDGSVEIIKKYENRLAFWVSEKDNGQYDAVNKGLEKATGEILTYLNADDILFKGSLFVVAQIFSRYKEVEWLGGIPNQIDEKGQCIWVGNFPKWNKYKYYTRDYKFIQQEGTFWRKSLWLKTGSCISTQYSLASDLELWSRFFQQAEYYILPILLAAFRIRGENQKSLDLYEEYICEAEDILSKMKISKQELAIVEIYNRLKIRWLIKLPVFKHIPFVKKIYNKLNSFPETFYFDRKKQSFEKHI